MDTNGITRVDASRIDAEGRRSSSERVVIEEPLEIRIAFDEGTTRIEKSISITMRTPGDDHDLACGFLFTEAIVDRPESVQSIRHCGPPVSPGGPQNTVRLDLASGIGVDYKRLERHFYTSSSCGVCGKTSIEALKVDPGSRLPEDSPVVTAEVIHSLPSALRQAQEVFSETGGLHAAALFDVEGRLLDVREDVGRHNALDKVIGAAFRESRLPLHDSIVMLSGRAGFELVQKSLMAGIPIVAAVSAPSSLAIDLARAHGMTVLGFVRQRRFNIYSGSWRIAPTG